MRSSFSMTSKNCIHMHSLEKTFVNIHGAFVCIHMCVLHSSAFQVELHSLCAAFFFILHAFFAFTSWVHSRAFCTAPHSLTILARHHSGRWSHSLFTSLHYHPSSFASTAFTHIRAARSHSDTFKKGCIHQHYKTLQTPPSAVRSGSRHL